jgi:hypothetical protein
MYLLETMLDIDIKTFPPAWGVDVEEAISDKIKPTNYII